VKLVATPVVCPDNPGIWAHVNGWEVVAAVLIIAGSYAATNVARMYFMMRVAQHRDDSHGNEKQA